MEFSRLWRILLGYRKMIMVITLSATFVAVALTYALPPVYEATALVLVRPGEKIRLSPARGQDKEVLDFPVSQSSPIDAPSKTYMEVIQSRAVAEKIVRTLKLDAPEVDDGASFFERLKDSLKDWFKGLVKSIRHIFKYGQIIQVSPFEEAVETVQENLKLDVKKNTYVFMITYGATDPKEAADVANKAAEIFLEHNAEAFKKESVELREFLEKRLVQSTIELDRARQKLLEFKTAAGTFSLDEEYAEDLKVISDLEIDLAKTDAELAGLLEQYSADSPRASSVNAERARLLESVTALRKKLEASPGKEKALETLKLAVRAAEDKYDFIRRRYEEAAIQSANTADEIRIVSRAVPPVFISKPLKYVYGLLGFLFSLVFSTALALFLEYLHPRVRTIEDARNDLNLTVLGTIPKIKAP